jgi:hypothetical protein
MALLSIIAILVCDFIKEIGWTVLVCLIGYILYDYFCYLFGDKADFHYLEALLILGGLSLILFIAHKLPDWVLDGI